MTLYGKHLIAGWTNGENTEGFRAWDPVQGAGLDPVFCEASSADIDAAVEAAEAASDAYAATEPAHRADFLERIALEIEGARRHIGRTRQSGDRASRGPYSGGTGPHRVPVAALCRARAGRVLGRCPHRPGYAGSYASSQTRPAPYVRAPRAGGRIRGQQFSAGLFGGRGRHRFCAGCRLPGNLQGASGASRHVRAGGPDYPPGRRG